jgi:hypothetical protein
MTLTNRPQILELGSKGRFVRGRDEVRFLRSAFFLQFLVILFLIRLKHSD